MNVGKQELVESLVKNVGLSKKDAEKAYSVMFDTISDALTKGGKAKIFGFGSFEVRLRKEREGRNPQTGDKITIPEMKSVGFKVSKALKEAIN